MITFRTTNIVFATLLIILCILWLTGFQLNFWIPVFLICLYLTISVSFSFVMSSDFFIKSLTRGQTEEKVLALTFDDGPDVEFTNKILDILAENHVPATFFLIGRKIPGNEQLIRRMVDEGHLIGMHSFSHSGWFDLFSAGRMKKEFLQTEELLLEITGMRPLLFRPPYGVINPLVKKALKGTPYHIIGFSNRAWDTATGKEGKVLSRIIRKIRPGDIVLLHDTVQQNINVLRQLIGHLEKESFQVIPLDHLLNIQPYA